MQSKILNFIFFFEKAQNLIWFYPETLFLYIIIDYKKPKPFSFYMWLGKQAEIFEFLKINKNLPFFSKAVIWRSSVKKVDLELYFKKRLQHRYFPVNFVKFLRTPFFTEHLPWLLLSFIILTFTILEKNRHFFPFIIYLVASFMLV